MNHLANHLAIINHLFDLEKKLARLPADASLQRPVTRIWDQFAEMGYLISNPLGEAYADTRTDCEASIAGDDLTNLHIQTVLKPAVYQNTNTGRSLVQKAVVIVQSIS